MRPQTLDEFQGESNRDVIERLRIAIASAKHRNTVLPNILFYGEPGLGKTTLSNIVANEMNSKCIVRTGGSISSQKDIFAILYEIDAIQENNKNALLFFDEIHKLSVKDMPEEMFYSILEDHIFYSNLAGKELMLDNKNIMITDNVLTTKESFSIVGATTSPGALKKPLRDRFTLQCYLKAYSVEDLIKIIVFNSTKENIAIEENAIKELAQRARGVPRIVINFLKSCRDRSIFKNEQAITLPTVLEEMKLQCIEEDGLTQLDLKVLSTLAQQKKGMGLRTLAGTCSLDVTTLEEMVLPFLSARSYVITTSKRFITDLGQQRLNKYLSK